MVWCYKRQYTNKILTLRKIYEYASELNKLRKFVHFHIQKLLFPSIFVGSSGTLSQKHIYIQVSNYICIHIQSMQFPCITYCMALAAIYKWRYTDETLTLRKSMYMRASGESEPTKFLHFHILKLLFLSIFCWYKWHACRLARTNKFPNVPTKLRKSIIGGQLPSLPPPTPPPPGYANGLITPPTV